MRFKLGSPLCVYLCGRATGAVDAVADMSCVPLPFFPLPIGDNITMLTTADWLLGSNSQSSAGLSTPLAAQWKNKMCFLLLFFFFAPLSE